MTVSIFKQGFIEDCANKISNLNGTVNLLKATDVYTSNGWILQHVTYDFNEVFKNISETKLVNVLIKIKQVYS